MHCTALCSYWRCREHRHCSCSTSCCFVFTTMFLLLQHLVLLHSSCGMRKLLLLFAALAQPSLHSCHSKLACCCSIHWGASLQISCKGTADSSSSRRSLFSFPVLRRPLNQQLCAANQHHIAMLQLYLLALCDRLNAALASIEQGVLLTLHHSGAIGRPCITQI